MSNLVGSTLSFPFVADVRGTLATTSDRSEIIAQAIQDILETRKGERKMLPEFGLKDYSFSVQDFGFAAMLAYELESQILNYVPLVRSVAVTTAFDEENRTVVSIDYTEVGQINSPKNLVFPVWRFLND